jgi:hypothetical protein
MERALRQLLQRLEAVDEHHDGLGDTIVRDLMGDDILRGFLRREPGFVPTGDYDLGAEANRLVADAIARFIADARAAASLGGLSTFHQRLAAFQNLEVETASGANYNDFFGYSDGSWFDAAGNDLR